MMRVVFVMFMSETYSVMESLWEMMYSFNAGMSSLSLSLSRTKNVVTAPLCSDVLDSNSIVLWCTIPRYKIITIVMSSKVPFIPVILRKPRHSHRKAQNMPFLILETAFCIFFTTIKMHAVLCVLWRIKFI